MAERERLPALSDSLAMWANARMAEAQHHEPPVERGCPYDCFDVMEQSVEEMLGHFDRCEAEAAYRYGMEHEGENCED
jgi:hypothetical protein